MARGRSSTVSSHSRADPPRRSMPPSSVDSVDMSSKHPQRPDIQDGRARLNERLRAAFIEGAEEDSRRRLGRGLTREELGRILRRYPGDVEASQPLKVVAE